MKNQIFCSEFCNILDGGYRTYVPTYREPRPYLFDIKQHQKHQTLCTISYRTAHCPSSLVPRPSSLVPRTRSCYRIEWRVACQHTILLLLPVYHTEQIITMPHMFTPLGAGPRKYDNFAITLQEEKFIFTSQKFWEELNAWTYLIGRLAFVVGSVLFFPEFSEYENVGCWIFIVASIFYALVSCHDMAKLLSRPDKDMTETVRIDFAAALSYIIGSCLFIVGSVLFLPHVDLVIAGSW